jgi:hypothetical protein
MDAHTLGGLVLGLFAVLVGAAWLVGALRMRGRRAEIASTYAASGGILYTAFQMGCASVLLLAGIGILGLVLRGGFR